MAYPRPRPPPHSSRYVGCTVAFFYTITWICNDGFCVVVFTFCFIFILISSRLHRVPPLFATGGVFELSYYHTIIPYHTRARVTLHLTDKNAFLGDFFF